MISYKLAKKLKDAGFEIKKKYSCTICGYCETNKATWCDLGCGSDYNEMKEVTSYCPTLSELIDACGDKEIWLTRYSNGKGNAKIVKLDLEEDGENLEEAVAKLFIELSGKSG